MNKIIVKNLWPAVNITENFSRSLKRWETQCLGGGGDDDDFCSSSGGSGLTTEISAALSDEAQPQRTNAAPPLLTTRTSFSSIIPASRRSAWM
uniref:Uncharacterized protein n=1 Tax=Romanomermis culicivorax TaxID=13658 RepID=A0A915ID55_ROMCU